MIHTIVSGGQTGADQGGLQGAVRAGLQTGGWAPPAFLTEAGFAPWLAELYGLREHPAVPGNRNPYTPRTESNVRESDATVIIGDVESPGSRATIRFCRAHGRPRLLLRRGITVREAAGKLERFCVEHNPGVLNIAGNRESVYPGIQAAVDRIIYITFC